jgi:hypothetical protein
MPTLFCGKEMPLMRISNMFKDGFCGIVLRVCSFTMPALTVVRLDRFLWNIACIVLLILSVDLLTRNLEDNYNQKTGKNS